MRCGRWAGAGSLFWGARTEGHSFPSRPGDRQRGQRKPVLLSLRVGMPRGACPSQPRRPSCSLTGICTLRPGPRAFVTRSGEGLFAR